MSLKSALHRLTQDQRKLTAARNATTDPRIRRTIELKQQMLGRRIGHTQIEEKLSQKANERSS